MRWSLSFNWSEPSTRLLTLAVLSRNFLVKSAAFLHLFECKITSQPCQCSPWNSSFAITVNTLIERGIFFTQTKRTLWSAAKLVTLHSSSHSSSLFTNTTLIAGLHKRSAISLLYIITLYHCFCHKAIHTERSSSNLEGSVGEQSTRQSTRKSVELTKPIQSNDERCSYRLSCLTLMLFNVRVV